MRTVGAAALRKHTAVILDGVQHKEESVVITRHGRHAAVLVSRDVLVRLFRQVEILEAAAVSYGAEPHPASLEVDEFRKQITYDGWFEVKE